MLRSTSLKVNIKQMQKLQREEMKECLQQHRFVSKSITFYIFRKLSLEFGRVVKS